MNSNNEIAVLEKQYEIIQAKQNAEFALTPVGQELKRFETLQRMGQMYAMSTIVPDTYNVNGVYSSLMEKERKANRQADPNLVWQQAQGVALANCSIALDMALRMNANPVMVMQNLYIVHGNPSWSSKFLIATINTCGRFMPLQYECNNASGDDYGWRCFTYAADDKDKKTRLDGTWITWAMVKSEGWDKKNGSKWNTMPEQMFKYRAAAFWQRMYAPEISMGFNTVEENQDIQDVEFVDVSNSFQLSSKAEKKQSISDLARKAAINAKNTNVDADDQPDGHPSPQAINEPTTPSATVEPAEEYGPKTEAKTASSQRSVAQQTADAAEYQRRKAAETEKRFAASSSSMFADNNDSQEGGQA